MTSSGALLDLWRDALTTATLVGAPFLVTALGVGLATSLLQAATQLQEQILSFVPKLIAVGLVIALGGNWLLDRLGTYTSRSISSIVQIGKEAGE